MACLDATFLIDFLRGRKEAVQLVKEWRESNTRVTIAAPALAEAASGAALESLGKEQQLLESFSSQLIVFPLSQKSAIRAGRIDASLTEAGEMIGLIDAMIAAVVIEHEEVLVTRNLGHFKRIQDLNVQGY